MLRVVVWLLLVAATFYVVFWVLDRRLTGPQERAQRRPRGRRTSRDAGDRPRGPDDDEDFLRELERRRREGP